MKGLQGKNVLVTGASSGIGQAVAVRFAREGARVGINYRSDAEEAAATEVKEACGDGALIVRADISDEQAVQEMFARTLAEFGRLDALINNAGIQIGGPSHEVSLADFEKVLAVNVRGTFLCSREAIRHFLSRPGGGNIVNNTSVHEIVPKPGYLSYSISKGGLQNLTRTLALEYAAVGIRVNAVGPGATITPINAAWTGDPVARARVESHIPMGRAAASEEMAAVFAFLASDEASYITGQTIYACGGITLFSEFRTNWSS
jgi:glucose 1-dehydrogenase